MIICFESVNAAPARIVEMDTDKNGILLRVFDRDALLKRNEDVGRARHHDFQIRFAQLAGKTFSHIESRDFLRAAKFAVGAVVFAAVSSIDDNSIERFAGVSCPRLRRPPSGSAGGEEARDNKQGEAVTELRHLGFLHYN